MGRVLNFIDTFSSSSSPSITSGSGLTVYADESISEGGDISHSAAINQLRRVDGSGGAVTASTTPFGSDDTLFIDGMKITVEGIDDSNTVTIGDSNIQYGTDMNGDIELGNGASITFSYNSTKERWIEQSRKES